MELDPDKHRLPAEQLRWLFESEVRADLFAGVPVAAPGTKPRAIVFGGQPGAGKSYAMRAAIRELGGPRAAVEIVGDDLRTYLPAYAGLLAADDKTAAFYTDRDSAVLIEMAIEMARTLRVPVAVEGTMRNVDKVAQTLHEFRQAGYVTEARALAVPFQQSWLGVLLRYEKQRQHRGHGRMTTPQAHQVAYDGLPGTIERIEQLLAADVISVFSRSGELLYRHDTAARRKSAPTTARQVIEERRAAAWPEVDHRMQLFHIDQLQRLLTKPERHATPAELASVVTLKRDARAAAARDEARRGPDLDRPR